MRKDIYNTENNSELSQTSSFFILVISIFAIFQFLTASTIVYANQEEVNSKVDVKSVIFNLDAEKERVSNRLKLVTIQRGNRIYNVITKSTDVVSILKEHKMGLEEDDLVLMNTEYIVNGTIIKIVKTATVYEEKVIEIPYEREIVKTDKYAKGDEKILQKGVLGAKIKKILKYYIDGKLVSSEIIEEYITREPIKEIVEVGTAWYSLDGIEKRGYNCPYWYSVVDGGPYNEEEKKWLKFIMYCESGCNAESNKSTYKGLFQWSPYWWGRQFKDNIFDGHAQIKNTISKYRAGEYTRSQQWPRCHEKYRDVYPL